MRLDKHLLLLKIESRRLNRTMTGKKTSLKNGIKPPPMNKKQLKKAETEQEEIPRVSIHTVSIKLTFQLIILCATIESAA
jgi:hypothetical protein